MNFPNSPEDPHHCLAAAKHHPIPPLADPEKLAESARFTTRSQGSSIKAMRNRRPHPSHPARSRTQKAGGCTAAITTVPNTPPPIGACCCWRSWTPTRTLPGVQRGAEFMLSATQGEVEQHLQENTQKYICFYGNLLRYTIHAGRLEDPRVARVVDYMNQDTTLFGFRCPWNSDLPCAWGAVRVLCGDWPPYRPLPARTGRSGDPLLPGLDFLLEGGSLVKADYPTHGKIHPLWFRLNFPLFYSADILFTLRLLKELDALDHPHAREALDWLRARRNAAGIWRGASSYRRRTWPGLLGPDDQHRWVTLQALTILKDH